MNALNRDHPQRENFRFPKLTLRRILFGLAGMVLGLLVPIGTYLLRLFVVFRGTQARSTCSSMSFGLTPRSIST